ncbi:WSC domain-containing protein [Lipomyces kononenkoae]
MVNGFVVGGFGGHCDLFNYTGMVVAVSTTPGVGVTSLYAMESSPGAPPVVSDITIQQGGKAGIWQSGMGISTDGNRIFFATGNGEGHANGETPSSGRTPLSTLDEVVADFGVSSAGKFSLTDYFEPYEYQAMDAGDRDLGSGGVMLPDPTVFAGFGVSQMAVTVGKNGKAYIMNANNLGGFAQGPGGSDNIIQTIIAQGAVFGGPGSYPLEGGYIYFTPVGFPTVCYKIGFDANGKPQFTLVGQTLTNSAGRVGTGIPTITTYQGQPGTGILWVADPDQGLQAFNAVPANGTLTPIPIPPTGGLNKFIRPAFGDGRVYVSDASGHVMCMGSPVALPLECAQPIDFGNLAIGNTENMMVNCTALIAIQDVIGCKTADPTFQCQNSSLPQGSLAAGATFSFLVTWNLTQVSIQNDPLASYGYIIPGVKGSSLTIYTNNAVSGYSNQLPVSVKGVIVSPTAFLSVIPGEVDFGGLVITSGGSYPTATSNVIISNIGNQTLVFQGFSWTNDSAESNVTINADGSASFGTDFSSPLFPAPDSALAPGASTTVPLIFAPYAVGEFAINLYFWTNGGNGYTILTGSGSTAPVANISHSTIEGGWDYSNPVVMDFGNVLAGTTSTMILRLCNSGGSALEVTKSKPPIDPELTAANPSVDLHEGQFIDVNTCAEAEIDIIAAPLGVNRPPHTVSDIWILNTNDLTFGVHDVQITANIVTRQVGPLLSNGSAQYLYLGCYLDTSGRQLQQEYSNTTNDNGWCQSKCLAGGYTFAGTEYSTECWCGNNPPSVSKFTDESLKLCSMQCPGDLTQACGGVGGYIGIYYDSTKYMPNSGSIPISSSSASSVAPTVSSSATIVVTTMSQTTATASASSSSSSTSRPIAVPTAGPYSFVGCYTEATTGRALNSMSYYNDSLTIEMCASVCAAYTWFGTEYARECYCGNSPQPGSVPTTSGCNMLCKGNPNEYCGGPNRLQMYNSLGTSSNISLSISAMSTTSPLSLSSSTTGPTVVQTAGPYSFVGCYTEATTGRALNSMSYYNDSLTVEMCASVCAAYTWFGTEYARECYCGNNPQPGSVPTTSGCNMLCEGNPNEYCGGPNRLQMYNSLGMRPNISYSSSSSATVTATPSVVPSVGAYSYIGCYTEATGQRALTGMAYYNDSLTVEMCASVCNAFTRFGVEYSRECYCGNTINAGSVLTTSGCSMLCKGNSLEYCGGPVRLNMYSNIPGNLSQTPSSTFTATST